MNNIYRVYGMTCDHCKETIERCLLEQKGVQEAQVSLEFRSLRIVFDAKQISFKDIKAILLEQGYEVVEEQHRSKHTQQVWLTIGVAVVLFWLIGRIVPDFSMLLTSGDPLGLMMLFVIGVTTSFHCVSMCGGLALSQVTIGTDPIKRNMAYNLGRILSYTLLGGIVGWIGSGITLGNRFFAVVPIVLGFLMVMTGLGQVGVISAEKLPFMKHFNLKMGLMRSRLSHDRGPFIVGLLNGLMPCGPLQLMQIYALGTGSFWRGAMAMLAFSLGTVPMMLGVGLVMNKLSGVSKALVFKVGGCLVVLLGGSMMLNGLTTAGINVGGRGAVVEERQDANQGGLEEGYQIVNVDVGYRSYGDIVVQKNQPVRLVMNVAPGMLTGCNYAINIPEYDIFATLEEGENVFEFLPTEEGTFVYSCWMGMTRNTITVVEGDISTYVPEQIPTPSYGVNRGYRCH
ncbi:MAG: sulfite exporter TauE/SafE family protein [Cellulosilyticaceae bacterium]